MLFETVFVFKEQLFLNRLSSKIIMFNDCPTFFYIEHFLLKFLVVSLLEIFPVAKFSFTVLIRQSLYHV